MSAPQIRQPDSGLAPLTLFSSNSCRGDASPGRTLSDRNGKGCKLCAGTQVAAGPKTIKHLAAMAYERRAAGTQATPAIGRHCILQRYFRRPRPSTSGDSIPSSLIFR